MSKVIVVSGASSGIGKATAEHLTEKGYQVIGLSRTYPKEKYQYDYVLCDLALEADIDRAIEEIEKKVDHIDVLINCAGIGISGAVEYTSLKEVEKIFQVNVIGQFYMTKKALPLLRKADKAKIINIGSVAGELTIPFQTFYSMTKSAIHRFTEGLRIELKPFGIEVATVFPGDTKTGFTENRYQPEVIENDAYKDRIKRSIQKMEHDETNGMSPMSVVKVITRLIEKKHMPYHVTVGFVYKTLVLLSRILPKRLVYWIVTKMYG
ncbi:MAG TPA: SDR family oxidoreductase [Bacillota bacterium]|nr:SDR family oxidoreductase [Bacillota bacterium]HPJ23850.1 SDR family oxidoreductase [Bacillota bacterium]